MCSLLYLSKYDWAVVTWSALLYHGEKLPKFACISHKPCGPVETDAPLAAYKHKRAITIIIR